MKYDTLQGSYLTFLVTLIRLCLISLLICKIPHIIFSTKEMDGWWSGQAYGIKNNFTSGDHLLVLMGMPAKLTTAEEPFMHASQSPSVIVTPG